MITLTRIMLSLSLIIILASMALIAVIVLPLAGFLWLISDEQQFKGLTLNNL